MQVVGSISAGNAQADALNQQAEMYMKQATVYNKQIEVDRIENDRRINMEKAATAQESLARTEKLRRIIGSTIAAGAKAGISTQYGTITALNEESQYNFSAEQAIAQGNSNQRITSLNLNAAINEQNLANQAYGSVFNANQAYASAGQAKFQGYVNAAGSLMSYGMNQHNRGSVPTQTYQPGVSPTQTLSNGDVITWN